MTMGVLLATLSSYFLIRSTSENKLEAKDNLFLAATVGSLYCIAGLSAILYPGTAWIDPEFIRKDGGTQKPVFFGIVGLMWIGYGIDAWRMR